MQYVKLLKNVGEGNIDFDEAMKAAKAENRKPPALKTVRMKGALIPFVKDTVLTMHEASAAKYVERGLGEIVSAPEKG